MTEKQAFTTLKIDQHILDKFWQLSESTSTGIINATDQLVALLNKKEEKKDSLNQNLEVSEELTYSVKRLVKGLASSRESARQGFSVALCQILRKFDVVNVEDFLGLISKTLKQPKKDSKTEKGNYYLGEALAYLTLIQSGRLFQGEDSIIQKVVKGLLWVSDKRKYLQQICYNGICLIIKQVNSEVFQTKVWPEIEGILKCGWEACSPDVFSLLLYCRKYQSDTVDKGFLKKHWKTKKIFKEDNFPKIWNVLVKGAACYPVLHHVNTEVVQYLTENDLSPGQFWKVGQDMVFKKSSVQLLNLGFHILLKLLPLAKSSEEMKLLLSTETIKTWVKNVDGKLRDSNPLLTITKLFGSEMVKTMKSCSDTDIQTAIIESVVQTSAVLGNETNKVVDQLILQLNSDASKVFGKYLMKALEENQNSTDDFVRVGLLSLTDMISHLRILVTLPSTATDHLWHLDLLQFLALHSYWNVTAESSSLKHCSHTCEDLSEKLRKQYQDNFIRALTQLLVFKTESSKTSSVHAYKDTVYQLIEYIQTLLNEKKSVVLLKPISEQNKDDWATVYKHLQCIHTKDDATSNSLNHAFELLFLFNAIHLLTDSDQDNSGLEDLFACHKKATESRRKSVSKKSKSEPEWIEVLTELLLSMMSQGSTYARMVAKNVFACLTNHITPEALSLITEVLKVEKPGEGDGQIDIEDEDEDMEDIESDLDIQGQDVEATENAESDSDEDTDDSESDGEVNEEFKTALKSALGPAAIEKEEDDDNDDEDEPDLSDSEMFRLDDALSQVFKNMKKNREKERKETQKQLNVFKLRVLDLVESLVKSHPPADLVLDLLFPLLQLMKHGEKHKENRELSGRATNIFKMMYRNAKLHSNTIVGTDKYIESIKSVIDFSKQVFDKSLVLHSSDACFLVIRLLLHLELNDLGPSPRKTRSHKDENTKKSKVEQEQERLHTELINLLETNLQLFLQKRESKLNPVFFTNLLTKAPVVCWPLTECLVEVIKDKDSKVYFKTQACSMLALLINKNTHDSLEASVWKEFSSETIECIENIIKELTPEEIKNKLLTEMLGVLCKLIPLTPEAQISEDVIEKLTSQRQKFNTDTRRMFNALNSKLQTHKSSEKRKTETGPDEASPKKKKKKSK